MRMLLLRALPVATSPENPPDGVHSMLAMWHVLGQASFAFDGGRVFFLDLV
jgi:hypothetical protein